MQSLISIGQSVIDGLSVQTVNARDLHGFLESKQQFSNWIQNHISTFGFSQGVDFVVINNFIKDDTAFGGKRKVVDYHLSLDMAKELAMLERNAKGKQARQYFIECERVAKQSLASLPNFADPAEAAIAWANEYKAKRAALAVIEEQAPKVQAYDVIATAAVGSMNITDAAKTLGVMPSKLFALLSELKWIYKRGGVGSWIAFQDKIDAGYLETVGATAYNTGEPVLRHSVKVTAKGVAKLSDMLVRGALIAKTLPAPVTD